MAKPRQTTVSECVITCFNMLLQPPSSHLLDVTKTKSKKNRIGNFRMFVVPLFTSPKRRENYSYVHDSNSTRGSSCCRRGNISAGSLFGAIAEVITRESRERAHGMQQQPQRVNIATNTEIETRIEETRTLYLPNASIQESHVLVLLRCVNEDPKAN